MSREEAVRLIEAFNNCVPFIPPVFADQVSKSSAMQKILAIGNGVATCKVELIAPAKEQPAQG